MSTPSPALTPIAPEERVFNTFSHAALWFSLGVGLLVMQVGAYLVPAVGTRDALVAIVVGSVLGSGLLAWVAKLGCDSGLSSAGLMHRVYGAHFARLPVLLNIVQLAGWTTFELVVMAEGSQAILQQVTGVTVPAFAGAVVWGLVLTALISGSMLGLVRGFVSRFGLPLVIASLLWLSAHFLGVLQERGVAAFLDRPGTGAMGFFSAIDLVIAMPISWLPLVADYARHGQRGSGALRGTWLGYALANAWCYALGVLVASLSEPGAPLVTALLLAQGGLLALGLILLDELDNAYGDVYSGAVSANSLLPRQSVRRWGLLFALVSTALACVLPMHDIEPFLLLLSSVFVPLYGVILGRLSWGGVSHATPATGWDRTAALAWLLGVVCFHTLAQLAPQWGSALPTLALTSALGWLTRAREGAPAH